MGKKLQRGSILGTRSNLLYVVRVSRIGNRSYGKSISDMASAVSNIIQKGMDASAVEDKYNRAFDIAVESFATKEEREQFRRGYELAAGKTPDPRWPLLRFFTGEEMAAHEKPTVSNLAPVSFLCTDWDGGSLSDSCSGDSEESDSEEEDDDEDDDESETESSASADDGEDIEQSDESDSEDI
jgi:hypothetical protein